MAAMVVTPQTGPPALETCFGPPFLPELPEMGILAVIKGGVVTVTVAGSGRTIVGVIVGFGATVGLGVWVLISSPAIISGVSKEEDGWVRRET
jgi:hypothetical protein